MKTAIQGVARAKRVESVLRDVAGVHADGYTVGGVESGLGCSGAPPAIHVDGLSVSYGGSTVLNGVSIEIQKGCITALIGPSGCGKTTFLSSLNRLIDLVPQTKVRGKVCIDGVDIREPSVDVRALRSKVGMVFQRPNPFPFSIRRNLELPLREHGMTNKSEIADRIEKVLRDVGLWQELDGKLERSALALSGGQQQRLCIARALTLEPEILLMDEPCSALDPLSSGVVEDLISSMMNKYTVVIVTHNLAQAKRIANFVAFFWVKERAGALIEFGKCCDIFEAPNDPLTADYVFGTRG